MSDKTENSSADGKKNIDFMIDGRPFSTKTPRQEAQDILRLSGLDPASYDLAEIRPGNAQPKRYADHDFVRIKDGDRFVTIRHSAEVA